MLEAPMQRPKRVGVDMADRVVGEPKLVQFGETLESAGAQRFELITAEIELQAADALSTRLLLPTS